MKFNSQICTSVDQSKRLLELGLKPETADMELIYNIFSNTYEPLPKAFPSANKCEIPAWSLHRLIELGDFNVECEGIFWRIMGTYFSESCNKIYDTIIDSIETLIIENLFNKEYLAMTGEDRYFKKSDKKFER